MATDIIDYWYSFLDERNSMWYYYSVCESNSELSREKAMATAIANYFDEGLEGEPEEFLQKKKDTFNNVPIGEVRITDKMLQDGASDNGGFNSKQLEIFGEGYPLESGWYQRILGKVVSEEAYEKFLSYKNDHLNSTTQKDKSQGFENEEGEKVRLSESMIRAGQSSNGAFNKKQVKALGLSWPLQKGWIRRLTGELIEKNDYNKFLDYKNDHLEEKKGTDLDIEEGLSYLKELICDYDRTKQKLAKYRREGDLGEEEKARIGIKINLLKEFISNISRLKSKFIK